MKRFIVAMFVVCAIVSANFAQAKPEKTDNASRPTNPKTVCVKKTDTKTAPVKKEEAKKADAKAEPAAKKADKEVKATTPKK
ncbi:MAG: hypothetical protein LWX56_00455 [Ignavibacteria bacterium]|nr:hypothetical protein [Ignavibacteria bacterium]